MSKQTFIELFKAYIKRPGADKLLAYLESSDFFDAPASTKYHLSVKGGLCKHSLNVYRRFLSEVILEYGEEKSNELMETIAVCALLHDVCKTDFYKVEMRNKKNESGNWVKEPYYTVDDALPYGHGEKSVLIVSGFIKLTREETMAIRWHMGGFDDSVRGGSYALGGAYSKFSLALLLHIADMKATYLDEVER